MKTLTPSTKNFLFLITPSFVIGGVALLSALTLNNPWAEGLATLATFILFVLFHSFKNGAFTKLQYTFEHGHADLWNDYNDEIKFSQILLASGVLAASLCKITNSYVDLNPYGWIGRLISAGVTSLLVLLIIFKQSEEYNVKKAFNADILYETIMIIIGIVIAVTLLTEIYLVWKTLYVLIPSGLIIIIRFSIFNPGVFPIKKSMAKKLLKEMLIMLVIPLISLGHQFFYNKFFWLILFTVVFLAVLFRSIVKLENKAKTVRV